MSYWLTKEQERFLDDGSYTPEACNGLRRMVADLRNRLSKKTIEYNDLKNTSL